ADHPDRQIEPVTIGLYLAGFEAVDAGSDDKDTLAPLIDRTFDLALQFAEIAREILGERLGDQRSEPLAAAEQDEEVAGNPVGVAIDDEIGEMDFGRSRFVYRDCG